MRALRVIKSWRAINISTLHGPHNSDPCESYGKGGESQRNLVNHVQER